MGVWVFFFGYFSPWVFFLSIDTVFDYKQFLKRKKCPRNNSFLLGKVNFCALYLEKCNCGICYPLIGQKREVDTNARDF